MCSNNCSTVSLGAFIKESFLKRKKLKTDLKEKFMSSKNLPTRPLKVVVVGDGGVGKSALTVQYVSHIFLDFHDPTIEDVYKTQRVIDGQADVLDILDTAGQDELQTALNEQQYLKQGDGYIAVYSITDARTFQNLRNHIRTLKRLHNSEKLPLVIVGNKLDLYGERTVSTAEGLSLARELDCPFYETSAVNRINVDDIFSGVIRKIRQRKHEDSPNNFTTMKPKIIRLRKIIGDKFRGKFTQLASLTTQPPL